MKRITLGLAVVALVFGAAPRAKAQTEVSINFFYDNLANEGDWIEVGDYGYCWQPRIAVSDHSWRPYADGYWAYTDVGWTWVSYEDFGWATYHYGRWARLRDRGWIWVPGTEWGPAWVSWRTGGDYVGWAPLPPRYGGGEPIYEGRPVSSNVDIEFDIGPEYYNFVDVRYIGEPVLRRRIFNPIQNITCINYTVNVTNITYNNSVVYNYGPDYSRLSAYSTRRIPRLQLQRESNVDLNAAVRNRQLTKVQGNQLLVASPMKMEKPAQIIAPKVVKTKIDKPNIVTGWSGVNDPKKKADLQAKFKAEDATSIPEPKVKPVHLEDLKNAGGVSPAATAAPEENTPLQSGTPVRNFPDRKRQRDDLSMPLNTASPTPSVLPNERKNKISELRGVKPSSSPVSQVNPVPESTIVPNENKNKDLRKSRTMQQLLSTPAPTATPAGAVGETKMTPHNLRPQRPVYAPGDGELRTTNKLKSEGAAAAGGAQNVQQSGRAAAKAAQTTVATAGPENAAGGTE